MSHHVSEELALIINLRNTALDHKKHCDMNCNVSLILLRLAAINIARWVKTYELVEANQLINEMPIS